MQDSSRTEVRSGWQKQRGLYGTVEEAAEKVEKADSPRTKVRVKE